MGDDRIKRVRCVGGVVGDGSGRLLLIKRLRPPGAGRWSLPGGKVEPGETDDEALRREVREETGLAVVVGEFAGRVSLPAPSGVFEVFDYSCSVTGGELAAGDDAADARWVDHAMFATMHGNGELVDDLAETLALWGVLPR